MRPPSYVVYLLACADGTLYCGIARDVQARIAEHAAGKGARYTRGRGPFVLLATRRCRDQSLALRIEYAVKQLPRAEKLALVAEPARLERIARRALRQRASRRMAPTTVAGRLVQLAFAIGVLLRAIPAQAAAPISIWFRATDDCPNGEAFVTRLSAHAVEGQIASVGDRIDFVVTLGKKDGQSSAVLERQSSEGTVALRELRGPSCDAVAEALALTLALTVDPDATPRDDGSQHPVATAVVTPAATEPAVPAAAATAGGATPDHIVADERNDRPRRARWLVGLLGSVDTIISGAPLWGGAAFVELHSTRGLKPSARLSFVAGTAKDPIPNVRLTLVTGRLEGCPVFLGSSVAIGACAALDLGALGASSSAAGGHSDSSFWSALSGITRLRYLSPDAGWYAELQGSLTVPFTRYRITGEEPGRTLAEVRAVGVGLGAGAGVSWQ